jgi:hypothetical protein
MGQARGLLSSEGVSHLIDLSDIAKTFLDFHQITMQSIENHIVISFLFQKNQL